MKMRLIFFWQQIVCNKTMEYKTFKSKVIGIQFTKDVFDEAKAN
jgi:hypothetical protein